MKRKIRFSIIAIAAVSMLGCSGLTPSGDGHIISHVQYQKVSTILERIRNLAPNEKYSLATADISFSYEQVDKIKTFDELQSFLEKEGYVVEIISNKYRTDLPKIISIAEKGKYAGNLSTVIFSPYPDRKLYEALLDLGSQIKFNIQMDAESLTESKDKAAPSKNFNGRTVSDFLAHIENAYDFHVDVDAKAATVNITKYKSKVFSVLSDREQIKKDAALFLSYDLETKKAKQYASENGKLFITGTPSVFQKATRYCSEVNSNNSEKMIVSFDGKTSVSAILSIVGKQASMDFRVVDGDFLPTKDESMWFEKFADVDKYIRKTYNKKFIKVSAVDMNRDGMDDLVTYSIRNVVGVPLDTPMTVSSFFKRLSEIDKNYYIVDSDANIPVSKLIIDDFAGLREYLYSSTGIILEITDSGDGLPKIIKVKNPY